MKTLITGMCRGELLPEYDKKFNRKKLNSFFRYIHSLSSEDRIDCKENEDAEEKLKNLKSESQIEIIGSYTEICVAASIHMAMSKGITTFSPQKYIFDYTGKPFREFDMDFSPIERGVLFFMECTHNNLENYEYSFEKGVHIFEPIF